MYVGDIVFLPVEGGYIKYIIKKKVDNEILVKTYKSRMLNWLDVSQVLTFDDFINIYKNEEIFE